ncbi:hypothetical protein K493DRAFT_411142 [Basidiobolus meristosporus CBS 931.73]|uniref:Uncharacterized protein n=1 Tax=Basidiobolus meristosporus CBS 931.73 TaxID=1314790 RepID=A0A1Y1XQ29_9FUNG|nr:hypothetical protein K493DRAFT_411142 [Basidiobolus meristosporus CBS 931.73]|eukprot:ORX87842.1 hypothetical protein K493DRAFT_411142 [Basidiobolus meristosporus CBS 931.73]
MFKRVTKGLEEVAESSDSELDSFSEGEEQESDFNSEEESYLKKALEEAGISEEEDWDDDSDVEKTTGLKVGELDREESDSEAHSENGDDDSDESASEGEEGEKEENEENEDAASEEAEDEYKTVFACDLCPEKVLKDEKMVELHLASHEHKKRERRLRQEQKLNRTPEEIEKLKAKNAKKKAKSLSAKKEALKKKRKAKKERQYQNKMAKTQ